jgi:hypothetical protein
MTGRIKTIKYSKGVIDAEDGSGILFDLSDVLAYDASHLAVGKTVCFTPENGRARNVSIQNGAPPVLPEVALKSGFFRYVGFDQADSVRTFRFERQFTGQPPEPFSFSAKLALLTKHHISFQDARGMCSRLLTLELHSDAAFERTLTDEDIMADAEFRRGPESKRQKRAARAV